MTTFQRRARWLVAIFAVGFAVMLAFAFKRRAPAPPPVVTSRTDPNSVVESTSGRVVKVKGAREDVSIEYDKQLTYKDGSTKLQGVKIVTTQRDGGRTFTVTGKEGSAAQNESAYTLHGDVRLLASDGLSAVTEHATFTESDGMVRAPGPVAFSRKGLTGSGIGMTYDNNQDVLVVLDQAHVKVTGRGGGGTTEITSATATLARRDRYVRFDQTIKALRAGQIIEADSAVAHLSEDEERLESVELRGHSRVTASNIAPGALQSVTGRDMDLKYGPDGESLEHVLITGDAVLQLAGQKSASGRQIKATILDIGLAPDGSTPVAVIGREAVQLTFQAEQDAGSRTITAMNLDARGEPGKGLTKALFTGAGTPGCADRRTAGPECYVEYREQNAGAGRVAKAGSLEVALKPGMSSIEEANFSQWVRFNEGLLGTVAAHAKYVPDTGTLELSGTEPGTTFTYVINEQIRIDATRIDVTLAGPKMKATGKVSSVLQPPKPTEKKGDTKMPSMLKGDQVVFIAADALDYDASLSKATYTGNAKLWQSETSVHAETIALDNKNGDLTGSGAVTTSAMLQMKSEKDKAKKERVRSVGTAKEFKYEESSRRATYDGSAHLSGPQGDMTADRIELYLQTSGDEIDRAEAYDKLTLREQSRTTTGARMTYTTANETYVITGLPVTIVDECGRESVGQKLTFVKATDTVTIDGGGQVRTQTKSTGKCS